MIEYKFDKEKEIILHYIKQLDDKTVLNIISVDKVSSKEDVQAVARFYWNMVDLSTKENDTNAGKFEGMDKWLERIYTTFHIYFNNSGYGDVWDNEIP